MVNEIKKQQSSSLWRQSIRAPLIVIVLLTTFALTILFYFSQDRNGEVYTRYIETLSEYKYLDARLLLEIDRYRYSEMGDSSSIETGIMSLREIAVSVSSSIETFRSVGDWMPAYSQVDVFEREVLHKISLMRRYLKERRMWHNERNEIALGVWQLPPQKAKEVLELLEYARLGNVIVDSLPSGIPKELETQIQRLLEKNRENFRMWNRLEYSRASLYAEDLILAFKARETVMQERRTMLSLIFYLCSIGMLLTALLLYVRVKR